MLIVNRVEDQLKNKSITTRGQDSEVYVFKFHFQVPVSFWYFWLLAVRTQIAVSKRFDLNILFRTLCFFSEWSDSVDHSRLGI